MQLTRQALFEAIWQTPQKHLANQWGISSQAITRLCTIHNIPLPRPGHWTHVDMGGSTTMPILNGEPDETVELVADKVQKTKLQEEVIIPCTKSLEDCLPLIRRTYRHYHSAKRRRRDRYNFIEREDNALPFIAVMPETLERACLLFDSIVRECERRGWQMNASDNHVIVNGQSVYVAVREQLIKTQVKSQYSWTAFDNVYVSSGILRFQYGRQAFPGEIKDGTKGKLEQKLPKLFAALNNKSVEFNAIAEDNQRFREQMAYRDKVRAFQQQGIQNNQTCVERLKALCGDFQRAQSIRSLHQHLIHAWKAEALTQEQQAWLDWIVSQADTLDPASRIGSLNYQVPVNIELYVSQYLNAEKVQDK